MGMDCLLVAGMVAAYDVGGAVEEARRCVTDLGFKSIFLPPATVNRQPWHHPLARFFELLITRPRRARAGRT